MLSRNILIFSAVVFLAPIFSTAPVEEKELEEAELEVETAEELSEEEEDEDDSKSRDMNMGIGAQKATAAPKGTGSASQHDASLEGGSSNGHRLNGGSSLQTGYHSTSSSTSATGGIQGGNVGEAHIQPSSSHDPSAEVPIGSSMETGFAGAGDHGSSMTQVHSPGGPGVSDPGSQITAPGNGQKLLVNGAQEGPAGPVDHFSIDPHTDLLGMADVFFPDIHAAVSDLGLDPGQSSSSGFHPDAPGGGDISSFGDHSLAPGDTAGFGAQDVQTSFLSDTTSAADVASTESTSSNGNGNGRHRPVIAIDQTVDPHGIDSQLDSTVITGVEAHTIIPQTDVMGEGSLHDAMPHTDITDLGMETVTSSHIPADATVTGDILSSSALGTAGLGEAVMDSGHTNTTELFLGSGLEAGITDSVNLQGEHIETAVPVTGDTLNTMSQAGGVGTVTANPQGVHDGLSQTGITPQGQRAASAAEQYITSGQGPQGTENVELEDTC
ncbi:hypothetical protein COCON_G00128130 [Conger conger]|uniref:Uncharacterized protein n=1 Tax=Conger conger TaxID=82655 RepID=A0A9Q1HWV7_CONCO|nr:hypothetical protein COCON_G00128130 [Conger conger]